MSEELEENIAMKWKMFMCHLPKTYDGGLWVMDYLEEQLLKQEIGGYVICHEEEPYPHYHFLVQMSNSEYHNYKQRCFIEKFKLRGRAKKDLPRQYGITSTRIRDVERAKSYTIKMCNNSDLLTGPLNQILRTNLSSEEINKAYENSFRKKDLEEQKKKLFSYLDTFKFKNLNYSAIDNYTYELIDKIKSIREQIDTEIIRFLLKPEIDLSFCKSSRDALFYRFIKQSKKLSENTKISLILYK